MSGQKKSKLGKNPLRPGKAADNSSIELAQVATEILLSARAESSGGGQPGDEIGQYSPITPENNAPSQAGAVLTEDLAFITAGLEDIRIKIADAAESFYAISGIAQALVTEHGLPKVGHELRVPALAAQQVASAIEEITCKCLARIGREAGISSQAATEGLIIRAAGEVFVLPVDCVREVLRLADNQTVSWAGRRMLEHRGEILAKFELGHLLGLELAARDPTAEYEHYGLVLRCGGDSIIIAVEALVGRQEIVVRPLPAGIEHSVGISGAAALGRGKIALVLTVNGLFSLAAKGSSAEPASSYSINQLL